jgi:hypothetical protein
MTIDEALTKAPAKCSWHFAQAHKSWRLWQEAEEEYDQKYASKFLRLRETENLAIDEVKSRLKLDPELIELRTRILKHEADYRDHRIKGETWDRVFQSAITQAYRERQELKHTYDTV